MSARVRAVNPLLAAEQETDHGPTRELFDALRANNWGVKWRQVGMAMLVHPQYGQMEVELDTDHMDRVTTFVDGRQVSHRYAMQRARGEI